MCAEGAGLQGAGMPVLLRLSIVAHHRRGVDASAAHKEDRFAVGAQQAGGLLMHTLPTSEV